MGNDGGSIPKRRELVKESARLPTTSELKATAFESLGHAWAHCAISDEKLDMDNVVSDWRGHLYSYESVLQGLVPSDDCSAVAAERDDKFAATGIASLRDVVRLKFQKLSPDPKAAAIWRCPLSLKEFGPATKAVYLVPCGHVFADVAMKEVSDSACPECSESFEPENIIPILPRETDELERLRQRIADLKEKGLSHNLKKDKSNGKKKRKADDDKDDKKKKAKDNAKKEASKSGNINNPMTASLTARVLAEQEERSKRRRLAAVAR
ncbi:hypothetical protein RB594_006820 [Gaeumannomyces avenae]